MKFIDLTVSRAVTASPEEVFDVTMQRPHLVEHTWVSEATRGVETIVSVTFQPRDGHTEVVLRHSGVLDDQLGRQHEEGWGWILSMLADRFAPNAKIFNE